MLQQAKKYSKQVLLMLAKFPMILSISCILTVIHSLDVIIDRINTPLAEWIDELCILLLSELDKYGAQVLGASFHVALAYLYVTAIRFLIPSIDSLLLFAGYYTNPAFIVTANVLTPALYNSLIVVLPLIAALGLLNKVICYKKIEKGSVNVITSPNEWKMRHNPLEYGVGLVFRILNKMQTIPVFFDEAYKSANQTNEWAYRKIAQITAYLVSEVKCFRRDDSGQATAQRTYFPRFNVIDPVQQTVVPTASVARSELTRQARAGFLIGFAKREEMRLRELSELNPNQDLGGFVAPMTQQTPANPVSLTLSRG